MRMAIELDPKAALIVVDVQLGFWDTQYWGEGNNPDFESNLSTLIAMWQETGRPIVVVSHDEDYPDLPLRPGQSGNDLVPMIASIAPQLRVSKVVNSAFYGTPQLLDWLTAESIKQLVIVGIQTNMCVETTARMGGNLGFDVIVPLDATRTYDLEGSDGTVMTADQLVTATAVNLSGGEFARVVSTAELVSP
jgi:nicotinamidase-related amidase